MYQALSYEARTKNFPENFQNGVHSNISVEKIGFFYDKKAGKYRLISINQHARASYDGHRYIK